MNPTIIHHNETSDVKIKFIQNNKMCPELNVKINNFDENQILKRIKTKNKVKRQNFYLCQWQWKGAQVSILYLVYRWLIAALSSTLVICSILDIDQSSNMKFENHQSKWWIYLTNWGLLAIAIQAWLATFIVTTGRTISKEDFKIVGYMKRTLAMNIYWILYTIATVFSFIISLCYWCLVYNPNLHKIDTVNIMVHILNTVIMFIDLLIVRHPIILRHIFFTTLFGFIYGVFTGFYYFGGGTDRLNRTIIYALLDWSKPIKTIIVIVCAVTFVFIVHLICYGVTRLRIFIFKKLFSRSLKEYEESDVEKDLYNNSYP